MSEGVATHYPKHLRVVGLDFATKTGYAILEGGKVRGGTFKVQRKKGRKNLPDDHEGTEYLAFQKWLNRLLRGVDPDWVCYEEPAMFKNPKTGLKPYAFRGMLLMNAANLGLELIGVQNMTLKKFATGYGGGKDKKIMISTAKEAFPGLDIVDDNMADAVHVLRYGLAVRGYEVL